MAMHNPNDDANAVAVGPIALTDVSGASLDGRSSGAFLARLTLSATLRATLLNVAMAVEELQAEMESDHRRLDRMRREHNALVTERDTLRMELQRSRARAKEERDASRDVLSEAKMMQKRLHAQIAKMSADIEREHQRVAWSKNMIERERLRAAEIEQELRRTRESLSQHTAETQSLRSAVAAGHDQLDVSKKAAAEVAERFATFVELEIERTRAEAVCIAAALHGIQSSRLWILKKFVARILGRPQRGGDF